MLKKMREKAAGVEVAMSSWKDLLLPVLITFGGAIAGIEVGRLADSLAIMAVIIITSSLVGFWVWLWAKRDSGRPWQRTLMNRLETLLFFLAVVAAVFTAHYFGLI